MNSRTPCSPRQGRCAGCGCDLRPDALALGLMPGGLQVTLCLRCGGRAMTEVAFNAKCVRAARVDDLFAKLGRALLADENAGRRVFDKLARKFEAEHPGVKAPSFAEFAAQFDAGARR